MSRSNRCLLHQRPSKTSRNFPWPIAHCSMARIEYFTQCSSKYKTRTNLSSFKFLINISNIHRLSKDSEKLTSIQLVPYRSPLDCHMNYFSFFKTNSLTRLFMPRSSLSEADSMFLAEAIASKVGIFSVLSVIFGLSINISLFFYY